MTDDPNRAPDAPTFDPADNPQSSDADFARRAFDSFDSEDDEPTNSAEPITRSDGSPVVDFGTYADAVAQAEALGLDATSVEAIGTAYRVNAE